MTIRTLTFAALAPSLFAQAPLHEQTVDLSGTPWDATIRETDPVSGAALNYEYDAMFPTEDAAGWAFDPANPGMHAIEGIVVALYDTEFATPNPFNVWVSTEAAPGGQPDWASAIGFMVNSPTGTAGPFGYFFEITFANPVLLPVGADVFLGVEFLAESAADHLELYLLPGDAALGAPTYDVGNARTSETGHGRDPNGSTRGGYGWAVDWTAQTFGPVDAQFAIAPLAAQSGFATAATTNQASLPSSNAPGRSAGLFSARQLSLAQDRLGNPRRDDATLLFHNASLTSGELVGFLFGLPGAAPIDLNLALPGSTGSYCLDGGALPLGPLRATDANGRAELGLTIPSSVRAPMPAGLIGLDIWFSALALDFSNGVAHGAACLVVRL